MPRAARLSIAALTLSGAVAIGAAQADQYGNSGDYNTPYGTAPGQTNQPIDPSLRDANGNLAVVNGVFTSSDMGMANTQQMSSLGAYSNGSTLMTGGVGFGNVAQAQAIGNQLNVVTVGSGNTVIVNSHQDNNGDVTANLDQ